jgi:probable rRNA maturation factor
MTVRRPKVFDSAPDRRRSELALRNRQRVRAVDLPLLRRITRKLLQELIGSQPYQLGIHLVAAREMRRLNEEFLGHKGSTDVITFDYARPAFGVPRSAFRITNVAHQLETRKPTHEPFLYGEIFICLDDAVRQARQFRTTWQSELVRYLIHGLLHLHGYDDLTLTARQKMKRQENRSHNAVANEFALSRLTRLNRKSQIPNRQWMTAPQG